MNNTIYYTDLGKKDYLETWELQDEIFQSIIQVKNKNRTYNHHFPTPNYLLFVEHNNVYTLGKSGDMNHLLISEKELKDKQLDFYKIDRGGDITFHGEGQVVAYPILDLDNFFTDIHLYLRNLEEVVIRTLAHYQIKSERSKGETGVWIDVGTPYARKICAMGIRASRWVTMHGLALNVNTDLSYFDNIIPCGIHGKPVTSIKAELGREVDMNEVKTLIRENFAEVFQSSLQENYSFLPLKKS